jgi:hypothetical protein
MLEISIISLTTQCSNHQLKKYFSFQTPWKLKFNAFSISDQSLSSTVKKVSLYTPKVCNALTAPKSLKTRNGPKGFERIIIGALNKKLIFDVLVLEVFTLPLHVVQ